MSRMTWIGLIALGMLGCTHPAEYAPCDIYEPAALTALDAARAAYPSNIPTAKSKMQEVINDLNQANDNLEGDNNVGNAVDAALTQANAVLNALNNGQPVNFNPLISAMTDIGGACSEHFSGGRAAPLEP